ncbi:alanine racemase [Allosphingosinicella sp.]|uniref:alanine racemase n=1 Tax=Allosphingosinicella sp. TaxID=2823234 RepID=UPI002EDC3ABC
MDEPRLDWRNKGLPPDAEGLTPGDIGRLGLNLLDGDMMMPVAILRERALRRNIAAMQAFADRIGALLCPHGKTSMSPELFAMQLAAGAWGLTAATAHHVRIYRRLGIGRIFLASQLAARADLDFIAGELAEDPELDLYCLVDSPESAELLAAAASRALLGRPIQLLIETGFAGGRAGVRDVDQALGLARRIGEAAPFLQLRGIETFEGIRQTVPQARSEAAEMIGLAVAAAEAAAAEGLFGEGPLLLSAGGSAFLDLCAAGLPARIGGLPVQRIIRPGCYVTHDHGLYARIAAEPKLEPALETWGSVLSLPEPGLAIVGVGKRDVSNDIDPPVPIGVHRPGKGTLPAEGLRTLGLWDQHLGLGCPPGSLAAGDLVGFGISHPCSTFDRWRALFTVDEDYRVTGAVTTLF